MGWARLLLLGNLGQQFDIEDRKKEIKDIRAELDRSRIYSIGDGRGVRILQSETDELRLYLAALVRLLMSKGILTKDEMQQVVDAVDAEDGIKDGKYKGGLS